jgi:hypothetical protein
MKPRCVCGHSYAAHGGHLKSGNSFGRAAEHQPGPCACCPCLGWIDPRPDIIEAFYPKEISWPEKETTNQ